MGRKCNRLTFRRAVLFSFGDRIMENVDVQVDSDNTFDLEEYEAQTILIRTAPEGEFPLIERVGVIGGQPVHIVWGDKVWQMDAPEAD